MMIWTFTIKLSDFDDFDDELSGPRSGDSDSDLEDDD